MADSDLKLTFSDIYTKVSEFVGYGSSPTGTKLTRVKDLTYRGYRRFLFPKNVRTGRAHTWSFLKLPGKLTTEVGKNEYPLPENFDWFWYAPQYGSDSNYPPLRPVSSQQLVDLRAYDTSNSYPQVWTLQAMPYDVSVGTRYMLVLHPTVNGTYTIVYGYVTEPNKPTADGDYFVGSASESETILECSLAEAEANLDDMKTTHHNTRADDMIHTCIERDLKRVPASVGSLNKFNNAYWTNPEMARELRWIDAATSAYGVS
ncbi:MAG: phage adaptor protein [Candidatus Thorarchaeota archaeon]|jgi:hypothetical protein